MLGRLNDALQTAADVLAPPPSMLQSFEYHWKHVKNFYATNKVMPKMHIDNTNLPVHLEGMLKILIDEERLRNAATEQNLAHSSNHTPQKDVTANVECATSNKPHFAQPLRECFDFVLNNRPFDLLSDICLTDSPPGASVCILNWMRRFLSCLENPRLEHKSIFQPIQKLIAYCSSAAGCASPYEAEEIVFLLTVAGVIRKEPLLLHLFLPAHEHTVATTCLNPSLGMKAPIRNTLFENVKLDASLRRISLVQDTVAKHIDETTEVNPENDTTKQVIADASNSSCDCKETDSFTLFDTILRYSESADSVIVVRACEAILILMSLPSISSKCLAQTASFQRFCKYLSEKLAFLSQEIPEDMNSGDIEECISSWGLLPRDADAQHFIGRPQIMEFLCWLDYTNCLAKNCVASDVVQQLAEYVRIDLFEMAIEPMISILDSNVAGFTLVLLAKIIKQIDSKELCDELATWLVGPNIVDNEDATRNDNNDCLLNIIIENAQENIEILLPTLQFVEALLDNTNERILHSLIFRYIETRGYYDATAAPNIQTWSDEEDEREKRRSSASEPMKSTTLKPNNILKVINNFLLLLPRQIISDSIGTCYEEYVQDANRHYRIWIAKTKNFNWPIEAVCHSKDDEDDKKSGSPLLPEPLPLPAATANSKLQSCDSGIAEEQFYEGPLLRMLFLHIRNMAKHPYELNISVIAILSKLSFLPHPYLHEILLNPEIPVARGTNTLWSNMQQLARHLLLEIPRIEGFQKRITETAKRLLINPPIISESCEEYDYLFESLVALEEFCKELAAIAFIKYHHATEE